MYCYRNLEFHNTTVGMFNRDRNFKLGIASRETIILNSTIVNDFQDSKAMTLIM